jgi:hypothetical protein
LRQENLVVTLKQSASVRGAATETPSLRRVYAGVASIPSRSKSLEAAIASIYDQVDEVFVYLNGYEKVPAYLRKPRIVVYRSQDYGDLHDVGKFYGLNSGISGLYFSFDDDIKYPPDYVHVLSRALKALDYKAAVGVHSLYYMNAPISFFDRRGVHYTKAAPYLWPSSVLGTGTVAFSTELGVDLSIFRSGGMADIWFALFLKEKSIPAVAVARSDNWLTDLPQTESTIYQATKQDSALPSRALVGARPWGAYDLISRIRKNGLEPAFPKAWRDFAGFYTTFLESGAEVAVLGLTNATPPATLKAFSELLPYYCDEKEQLEICTAIVESTNPALLPFSTMIGTINHAPNETGFLLERAARIAASRGREGTQQDFLLRAARSYRTGKHFARAAHVVELLSQSVSNPAIQRETVSVIGRLGDYELLMRKLMLYEKGIGRDAIFSLMLGVACLNLYGLEYALPSFAQFLTQKRDKNWQAFLVAHCQEFRGPPPKVFPTAELRIAEARLIRDRADLSDVVNFYIALGQLAAARDLLNRTEDSIRGFRGKAYVEHLRAAVAGSFREAIEELNCDYVDKGLEPLSVNEDASGLSLGKIVAAAPSFKNDVKISVIITAFNAEATIRYALRSVLAQSYSNIEAIVVDDRSTDATISIVEEMAARDPRVMIVRSPENSGPYTCRNLGLSVASGEFIAMHDADDYDHPQRLEWQIRAFDDPNIVACFAAHIRVSAAGQIVLENHGHVRGHGPVTMMVRSRVIQELGGFVSARTRGDMEYRSRVTAFYGAHALAEQPEVVTLALDSPGSNSRRMIGDADRVWQLELFKSGYRGRHISARGRRERLNVAAGDLTALESASAGKSGARTLVDDIRAALLNKHWG